MKLKKKIMALACVAMMTAGLSAFATSPSPNLVVKDVTATTGNYIASVPMVSGAEGGAKIDEAANLALSKNAMLSYYTILPEKPTANAEKLNADFSKLFPQSNPASVKDAHQMLDIMTRYADFLSKKQDVKGQYAKETYAVRTSFSNLLSVEQNFNYYTGGAHDNMDIKTFNMNMKDGRNLTLSDFFIKGSDWKGRLTEMVNIQRIGYERMMAQLGKKVGKTQPIKITGNEKFTFTVNKDVLIELHILYAPGEVAPMSEGEMTFDIPAVTFSDIMNYNI
jgi:hypothetical protein